MKRRLSQAGFIRTVDNEDWISNIVKIAKKALCVYASSSLHRLPQPQQSLPKGWKSPTQSLPIIDVLVDSSAGHERRSFMDGFSGYNQIKLAEKDQPHLS